MSKGKGVRAYNRLLFRVGIIVFISLLLATFGASVQSYLMVMDGERDDALEIASDLSESIKGSMRDDTLQWLFDYWKSHSEEMEFLPPVEESDQKRSDAWDEEHDKIIDLYLNQQSTITPADLEQLSEEEQKLFAEYCYSVNWAIANAIAKFGNKDGIQYSVYQYIGDDQVYVYLGNWVEDGKQSALGRIDHMQLDQHPVIKKILEGETEPKNVEHVIIPDQNQDILSAVWPIVLDQKVSYLVDVMYPWADTKQDLLGRLYRNGGKTLIFLVAADILLLFMLNGMVIRPIRKLQVGIREYSKDKDSRTVETDLGRVNQRKDEIGALSKDVTDLTKEMDRYVGEIYTLAQEKAAVGTELAIATKIQAEMLPCTFPAFPDRTEFTIFASMTPAKEVGGDFYDFFLLDDDHLALVMADVSGKGVPAALFMVVSRTLIKTQAQMCRSPKAILEEVDNKLYESNPEGMFVTVWLGILEISTGRILASNAGHEKPALKNTDGCFELVMDKHGMMLGAMPDIQYTEYEMQLEKGGCLFLYTDGVTEATDANCRLFGTDRMIEALNQEPDASPEVLLSNVKTATDAFVKEAPQFDDITMLAIQWQGKHE